MKKIMDYKNGDTLSISNYWVGFAAFFVAIILGVYQVAERAGFIPQSAELYFASVSTHGVLMGFVLTTFVIMGFGYFTACRSLKQPLWNKKLAWYGFYLTLFGVLLAAYPLLTGQASIMFTFYPPLAAHPIFYIGATLLVVGSWIWVLQMIMMTLTWKRANPGEAVPLVQFGNTANALLWAWTSIGVTLEVLTQLIPWSLGLIDEIDVALARVLFSWTLHAIVYFWLFPAYIAMYTLMPKLAGGRLFSDEMGRISFIMLLVISVPIGMHHLYMDPGVSAGWKFVHMLGTFAVMLPTLLTGFTVIASMELAGRLRGGQGLFGWIAKINWKDPLVLSVGLALLMLTIGGFGGAINAAYSMNAMVHNTQWITGHFHLIFAGTVVVVYMGTAYHFWPKITGRKLLSDANARLQLWLWMWGMFILTIPWHYIGLLGQPRRISSMPYDTPLVERWDLHELLMVVGGLMLLVSAIMLIVNLYLAQTKGSKENNTGLELSVPVHPVVSIPKVLNGFALWNWIIVVYLIVSYGYPILHFFISGDSVGVTPWGV